MNPRLFLRLRSAAVRSTPESIRAAHIWRDHELLADDVTARVAPRVLCDRRLDGWTPVARTVIRGVIR